MPFWKQYFVDAETFVQQQIHTDPLSVAIKM